MYLCACIKTEYCVINQGADLNARDRDGRSAMEWAQIKGYPHIEVGICTRTIVRM